MSNPTSYFSYCNEKHTFQYNFILYQFVHQIFLESCLAFAKLKKKHGMQMLISSSIAIDGANLLAITVKG